MSNLEKMTLWYSSIGIFILDFLFGFSFCFSSMLSLRHDSCIFRLTRAWNMEDMSWFAFAGGKVFLPGADRFPTGVGAADIDFGHIPLLPGSPERDRAERARPVM